MTSDEVKDLFAQELVIRLLDGDPDGPDANLVHALHTLLAKWQNTYRYGEYTEEYKTMLERYIPHLGLY